MVSDEGYIYLVGRLQSRDERERFFGSRERKLKITFPFYGKGTARINSRFDLFSCLDQPSAKLQIMILFPVLIPGQNLLFPGTGNYKMPREGKFKACIPENHAKREFPLTSASKVSLLNLQKVKEPRPPASQLKKENNAKILYRYLEVLQY